MKFDELLKGNASFGMMNINGNHVCPFSPVRNASIGIMQLQLTIAMGRFS